MGFFVNIASELPIHKSFCFEDYSGADSLADLFIHQVSPECRQSAGAILVTMHGAWNKRDHVPVLAG